MEVLQRLQSLQDELLPIAKRGALLYSVLRSMASLSKHYQFRLPQFLQMYFEAIGEDPPMDIFIEDDDEVSC